MVADSYWEKAILPVEKWNTRPIEDALNTRIAELEEENDRLQDGWFRDETICPDGSLRPKVSDLLNRIAELKELLNTERQLSDQFYLLLVDNHKTKKMADDLIEALRITTMKPTMVMDANHPLDMVREAGEHVTARIAELEAAQKEALSLLPELERGHYYCDDCWYSCPKAVDGCCDESRGDECDCGADDYNALLAKIIGLLTPEVQK